MDNIKNILNLKKNLSKILIYVAVIVTTICVISCAGTPQDKVDVRLEEPTFLMSETPIDNNVYEAIKHYKLEYPEIVYAQAVLETGNFRSLVCLDYNNLFGLWDNVKGDYYRFDHWSESILFYKDRIQNRYKKGEDYFIFLKRINYAKDANYEQKLAKIVKQIFF